MTAHDTRRPVPHHAAPFPRSWSLLVVGVALALRVLNLAGTAGAPDFHVPIIDCADYDDHARRLALEGAFHPYFFWQPVFYPFFLSLVYALTKASVVAALAVQAAVGSVTALLTARLGNRFFGPRNGLAAGLVVAAYGPLLFFESRLLATVWAALWAPALILLVDRAAERVRGRPWAVAGAGSAVAVLTRPTYLPFAVAALAWAAWHASRRGGKRRPRELAFATTAAVAAFAVVVIPVSFLNQSVTGHFGFLPASGGINLYIGNHPDAARYITMRPGDEWNDLAELPHPGRLSDDPYADSAWFTRHTFAFVRDHPGRTLAGFAVKTAEFASSREIPRSFDVYMFREWSPVLAALAWKWGAFGFPFGLLLPLALAGVLARGRRTPALFVLFLVLYSGSVILVFPSARYRAAIVPVVAVLAAEGALSLVAAVRGRAFRRGSVYALAALTAAVAIALPGPFPAERLKYRAEYYDLLGNRLWHDHPERSRPYYRTAVELDPANAGYHSHLGEALAQEGKFAEAIGQYDEAARLAPPTAVLLNQRGAARLNLGRVEEAVKDFTAAIELEATVPDAWSNRAAALLRLGRTAAAVRDLEKAVELAPGDPALRYNLGAVLFQTGDVTGARRCFEEALRLSPGYPPARDALRAIGPR